MQSHTLAQYSSVTNLGEHWSHVTLAYLLPTGEEFYACRSMIESEKQYSTTVDFHLDLRTIKAARQALPRR